MSMTDRELLERAAEAAGIDAEWQYQDNADFDAGHEGMWLKGARTPDNSKYWNPLHDSADALELAVKLHLRIHPMPGYGDDCVTCATDPVRVGCDAWATEPFGDDPAAATRRAITRAAAALAPLHPAAGGEAKS